MWWFRKKERKKKKSLFLILSEKLSDVIVVWKLNELLLWLRLSGRYFSCMCLAAFARELTLNSISEKRKKITRFPWNNDTSSARKSISLSTDLKLLAKDTSSAFLPSLLSSRFLQMCAMFEMKPVGVYARP